jgi:hypothetical protein
MQAELTLDPKFQDCVRELAMLEIQGRDLPEDEVRAQLGGWLDTPERLPVVRDGLTRALSSIDYRDIYLDYLRSIQEESRPLRRFQFLPEDSLDAVLDSGLSALDAGRLAILTVNPMALAEVWAAISEEYPPYWEEATGRTWELECVELGVPPVDVDAMVWALVDSVLPELE